MGSERDLLVLALALGLDFALGDPPNRWHPVVLMGGMIRTLARPALAWRKRPLLQFLYGGGLVLLGAAIFALPGLAIDWIPLPWWIDIPFRALMLKCVFSLRSLLRAGREVGCALRNGDLDEARRLTAWHLVSRDTSVLDAGHVASAAIESLAENITDSFLSPLLAFAVGGLPLAWAYRFVNTADAMIAYHGEPYEHLGKFTARLDDVLNFIPARLGGLFICLAAGITRLDGKEALGVMFAHHACTSSPNAGWTISAAAGALGVRLVKTGHYNLGKDTARLPEGATDLTRAERLVLGSAVLGGMLCAIVIALKG